MPNDAGMIVAMVSDLASRCRASECRFRQLAQTDADPEFSRLCDRYAMQRARFAETLEMILPAPWGRRPETPRPEEPQAALLDENAAILFCEQEEDQLEKAYHQAFDTYLPIWITKIIQAQYPDIQEARRRFQLLHHAIR